VELLAWLRCKWISSPDTARYCIVRRYLYHVYTYDSRSLLTTDTVVQRLQSSACHTHQHSNHTRATSFTVQQTLRSGLLSKSALVSQLDASPPFDRSSNRPLVQQAVKTRLGNGGARKTRAPTSAECNFPNALGPEEVCTVGLRLPSQADGSARSRTRRLFSILVCLPRHGRTASTRVCQPQLLQNDRRVASHETRA
jgi:hypothetical protein